MSSEVTLQGAGRIPAQPLPAEQRLNPSVAALAKNAPAPQMPAKPEINFDPKESQRKLSEAIAHLNDMVKSTGTNLNFSRDEVLNQVVITVKNTETGDVIRQIPDATFLKIAHNLESLKGLLHNEEI